MKYNKMIHLSKLFQCAIKSLPKLCLPVGYISVISLLKI